MLMVFLLTVTFVIILPAEGLVPLNQKTNLIPKETENEEKEDRLKTEELTKSYENFNFSEVKPRGFGIGEGSHFRGKNQIDREDRFVRTRPSVDDNKFVRRRYYRRRGELRDQNGDSVYFQGQDNTRALIDNSRQNCSSDQECQSRQNLPEVVINKFKYSNRTAHIEEKSGPERERMYNKQTELSGNYRTPNHLEQNHLGRPGQIDGQNRLVERIQTEGRNSVYDQFKNDREDRRAEIIKTSEQIELNGAKPTAETLLFAGRKPGEGTEKGASSTHWEQVLSKAQISPAKEQAGFVRSFGKPDQFQSQKRTRELLQFGEQKPEERYKFFGPIRKTATQALQRPRQQFPFGDQKLGKRVVLVRRLGEPEQLQTLKRTRQPLPFGDQKLGKRVALVRRIGKPEQLQRLNRTRQQLPFDEQALGKRVVFVRRLGKPEQLQTLKRTRQPLPFGDQKFGKRVALVRRIGKPEQLQMLHGPREQFQFEETKDPIDFFELRKQGQLQTLQRPREQLQFGKQKPGRRVALVKPEEITSPKRPLEELQSVDQKPEDPDEFVGPLGKKEQAETQTPSVETVNFRIDPIDRGTPPTESYYYREPVRFVGRGRLNRERTSNGQRQFGLQEWPRRPNYLGNGNRVDEPAQKGEPYSRYQPAGMRKSSFDEKIIENRLENPAQSGKEVPLYRQLSGKASSFVKEKIIGPNPLDDRNSSYGYRQSLDSELGGDIKDLEKKEVRNNTVVVIIPVPKGLGPSMKSYEGVKSYLAEIFPQLFIT